MSASVSSLQQSSKTRALTWRPTFFLETRATISVILRREDAASPVGGTRGGRQPPPPTPSGGFHHGRLSPCGCGGWHQPRRLSPYRDGVMANTRPPPTGRVLHPRDPVPHPRDAALTPRYPPRYHPPTLKALRLVVTLAQLGGRHEEGVEHGDALRQHRDLQPVLLLKGQGWGGDTHT